MTLLKRMLAYLPPAESTPSAPRVRPGERIVAIGDSITQNGGYLRAIDAVFAQEYPALALPPIVNAGISGHKAEDMIARFDRDVLAHRPDRVTINVGVNDVWHRLAEPDSGAVLTAYRDNVARMVASARDAGATVMLLTPTVIEENDASEGNRRLSRYIAAMKQVAADAGVDLADLHALFLAAIAANPQPHNWLTNDGVHMLPTGDAVMAIGVLRALGVPDEKTALVDPGLT